MIVSIFVAACPIQNEKTVILNSSEGSRAAALQLLFTGFFTVLRFRAAAFFSRP